MFVQWIRCFAIFVTAWVLYSIPVVVALFATEPGECRERRRFLKTAATRARWLPRGDLAAAAYITPDDLTFPEFEILRPGAS